MLPGLRFQPILGDNVMANLVHIDPHTEAPVHWHEEEQISIVIDGEFEFEVAGEKRIMKRGDAVVIPPNVPHGARTLDAELSRDGRLPSPAQRTPRSDGPGRNGLNAHDRNCRTPSLL